MVSPGDGCHFLVISWFTCSSQKWVFCPTSTALLQRSTGNLFAAAVALIYVGSRNREWCRQWQSPNSCVLSWRTQSFTLPPSIPNTHFSGFLWNSEVSSTVTGGQWVLLHWEASHCEVPLVRSAGTRLWASQIAFNYFSLQPWREKVKS